MEIVRVSKGTGRPSFRGAEAIAEVRPYLDGAAAVPRDMAERLGPAMVCHWAEKGLVFEPLSREYARVIPPGRAERLGLLFEPEPEPASTESQPPKNKSAKPKATRRQKAPRSKVREEIRARARAAVRAKASPLPLVSPAPWRMELVQARQEEQQRRAAAAVAAEHAAAAVRQQVDYAARFRR